MNDFLKHPSTVAIFGVLAWALSFAMGHPIDMNTMKWCFIILGVFPGIIMLLDLVWYIVFSNHLMADKTSVPLTFIPFVWAALFHTLSA